MKIPIDRKKYTSRLLLHLLLSFIFSCAAILVLILRESGTSEFNFKGAIIVIGLFFIAGICALPLYILFRLKSRQQDAIILTNDLLIDNTKLGIATVHLNDIDGIILRQSHSGRVQLIIRHKAGKSIYITNFLVRSEDLELLHKKLNDLIPGLL